MSEELQDERSKAVELLELHDELDALDQPLPPKEVGRLGLLLLLLLVLLFGGALISLAYGSIAIVLIVLDVAYGSIAIVLAGLLVYLRRVVRPRLSEEGEAIQSRIHQIEDAP